MIMWFLQWLDEKNRQGDKGMQQIPLTPSRDMNEKRDMEYASDDFVVVYVGLHVTTDKVGQSPLETKDYEEGHVTSHIGKFPQESRPKLGFRMRHGNGRCNPLHQLRIDLDGRGCKRQTYRSTSTKLRDGNLTDAGAVVLRTKERKLFG